MSKRKDKKQAAELYDRVTRLAARDRSTGRDLATGQNRIRDHRDDPITDEILAASKELSRVLDAAPLRSRDLPKMKKFRFQLLHQWMLGHITPCRVADIGGGKGLLAYLLQQSGWRVTVIDPIRQALPGKYKDMGTGKQIHLADTEFVPFIDHAFGASMAQDFDLLVALHAHGCNIRIIDAAAQFGRSFVVMPCCIIHEPVYPPAGMHWLQYIVDYATRKGFIVDPFRLNFKGQNIGLHGRGALR